MIEIRGIAIDRALETRVSKTLTAVLARFAVPLAPIRATFFDDDGPKGGPAVRCALTVRLPSRRQVRAEDTAGTARLAFDGGVAKLEREHERYRERDREDKRHPKKYYTARITRLS
jgi:ribosome-associated translation inhibitor RaiA